MSSTEPPWADALKNLDTYFASAAVLMRWALEQGDCEQAATDLARDLLEISCQAGVSVCPGSLCELMDEVAREASPAPGKELVVALKRVCEDLGN